MQAENTKYISTHVAATLLNVSIRTVQNWVKKDILQAWKTAGGHSRLLRSDIEQLIASQKSTSKNNQLKYIPKIVVIEDDPVSLLNILGQLELWPWQMNIETAVNGLDGLIKIGQCQPDIIITDLIMPGSDGFQMLEVLKTNNSLFNTKLIVVTALDNTEITRRGPLPKGVSLYFKPIDFKRMKNELADCFLIEQKQA
jgi:excisionase family DNA binding protein